MVSHQLASDDLARRDVRALEKELAEGLERAGHDVMNAVDARGVANEEVYEHVREAFAAHFADL